MRAVKPQLTEAVVEEKRRWQATAVGALVSVKLEHGVKGGHQAALVARLAANWNAICPLLAPWCWPLQLRRGVLSVAVTSDPVRQELFYATPTLLAAANMLAGYEAVKSVKFERRSPAEGARGTPLPPGRAMVKKPSAARVDSAERACKGVPDDDLRMALARLGAWVCRD